MEDKSTEQHRRADEEVRKNLPPGVKLVRTLRGHTGHIGRIAWSPDGRTLASPSQDKTIRLWDARTGACLRVLEVEGRVHNVAFDPSGRMLATGESNRNAVRLWEVRSGKLLRSLRGHDGFGLAFDPSGTAVVPRTGVRKRHRGQTPDVRLGLGPDAGDSVRPRLHLVTSSIPAGTGAQ